MAPTIHRPLCRYCGKPIPKRTRNVRFVDVLRSHMQGDQFTRYVVGQPMTKTEAQQLVNETVVSVKYGSNPWAEDTKKEYVIDAGIWDGESYADKYFCNGACAKDFAYMVARDRPELGSADWADAYRKQRGQTK